MASFEADKSKVNELFTRVMVETVERWVRMAEERLRDTGIKCFISPENDDRWEVDDVLNKSAAITNPEEKVLDLDQHHEMITLGVTNHTPWKSLESLRKPSLQKGLTRWLQVSRTWAAAYSIFITPLRNSHRACTKTRRDTQASGVGRTDGHGACWQHRGS